MGGSGVLKRIIERRRCHDRSRDYWLVPNSIFNEHQKLIVLGKPKRINETSDHTITKHNRRIVIE